MKTTAAVVEEPGGPFTLREIDLDHPRADEIVVRIEAVGVCHTDLSVRDTLPAEMFPRVFGHEGAGVVEEVGAEVGGVSPGDHVVLSYDSCRSCDRCRRLGAGYCEHTVMLNYMGFREDGSTTYSADGAPVYGSFFGQSSFSRHVLARATNAVVIDPSTDLALAAPYGCSFQTGAGTVLNVLGPEAGDSLAVYGVGAVGLAALAAAAHVERRVAVDLHPERLAVAEAYGAVPVDATGMDPAEVVAKVQELTGGGATRAVDTTGVGAVVKQAAQALAVKGRLVVLGLGAEEYPIDAVDLMMNGKQILGSVEGDADPHQMVPRLLGLRDSGDFAVDGLVQRYPFAEIETAIADALAGRVVKPVLVW